MLEYKASARVFAAAVPILFFANTVLLPMFFCFEKERIPILSKVNEELAFSAAAISQAPSSPMLFADMDSSFSEVFFLNASAKAFTPTAVILFPPTIPFECFKKPSNSGHTKKLERNRFQSEESQVMQQHGEMRKIKCKKL